MDVQILWHPNQQNTETEFHDLNKLRTVMDILAVKQFLGGKQWYRSWPFHIRREKKTASCNSSLFKYQLKTTTIHSTTLKLHNFSTSRVYNFSNSVTFCEREPWSPQQLMASNNKILISTFHSCVVFFLRGDFLYWRCLLGGYKRLSLMLQLTLLCSSWSDFPGNLLPKHWGVSRYGVERT